MAARAREKGSEHRFAADLDAFGARTVGERVAAVKRHIREFARSQGADLSVEAGDLGRRERHGAKRLLYRQALAYGESRAHGQQVERALVVIRSDGEAHARAVENVG